MQTSDNNRYRAIIYLKGLIVELGPTGTPAGFPPKHEVTEIFNLDRPTLAEAIDALNETLDSVKEK